MFWAIRAGVLCDGHPTQEADTLSKNRPVGKGQPALSITGGPAPSLPPRHPPTAPPRLHDPSPREAHGSLFCLSKSFVSNRRCESHSHSIYRVHRRNVASPGPNPTQSPTPADLRYTLSRMVCTCPWGHSPDSASLLAFADAGGFGGEADTVMCAPATWSPAGPRPSLPALQLPRPV